jgi:hypothetical protein
MTPPESAVLTGQCHCGAVQAEFHLGRSAAAIPVRACQCGFCRRHGAATASDPAGRVTIKSARPLIRYRFGAKTIDMLICGACGVYVAAILEAEGETRATINVAGLKMAPLFDATPVAVDYDQEDAASRHERRLAGWTPAEIMEPSQ